MDAQTTADGFRLGPAEWALLVLHSMLWGSGFVFIAVAVKELPIATIIAFRIVPAAALLYLIARLQGHAYPKGFDAWLPFFALALINILVPSMLTIYGQQHISSGVAAVLTATSPLFAVLVGHLITRDDRLSLAKLGGIVTGVVGVATLIGPNPADFSQGGVLPKLALVCAAALYALAATYARRFRGTPAVVLSGAHAVAGLVIAMPVALLVDRPWLLPAPSVRVVAAVFGLGLISMAFASLCYFTLIKRAGATNALLVTMLVPLTPITIGALVLGERLSGRELLGGVIILLALVIIDGRALPRLRAFASRRVGL